MTRRRCCCGYKGDMRDQIYGVYTYLEMISLITTFMPVMAVSYARHRGDATQREPGRWMRRLGRTMGRGTPLWKFTIEGEPPQTIQTQPHVVVANHESMTDPMLLSWLPWDMRWVAKKELFRPPVFGWTMTFGGDIPLQRGDGTSVRQMMEECKAALRDGISIMMFPEGTRSADGELLRFKDGAFQLAVEASVPVLPVAVAGTRAMWRKGSLKLGRAHACARILQPIMPSRELPEGEAVAQLRDAARDAIQAVLPDLRARYGTPTTP